MNLLISSINCNSPLVYFFRCFQYIILITVNSVYSFFNLHNFYLFYLMYFTWCIEHAKTSNTIGASGYPWFVTKLRGKQFNISCIILVIIVGFLLIVFTRLRNSGVLLKAMILGWQLIRVLHLKCFVLHLALS